MVKFWQACYTHIHTHILYYDKLLSSSSSVLNNNNNNNNVLRFSVIFIFSWFFSFHCSSSGIQSHEYFIECYPQKKMFFLLHSSFDHQIDSIYEYSLIIYFYLVHRNLSCLRFYKFVCFSSLSHTHTHTSFSFIHSFLGFIFHPYSQTSQQQQQNEFFFS